VSRDLLTISDNKAATIMYSKNKKLPH